MGVGKDVSWKIVYVYVYGSDGEILEKMENFSFVKYPPSGIYHLKYGKVSME